VLGDEIYVVGGDVITAVNGKPISALLDFRKELVKSRSRRQFALTVLRDGQIVELVLSIDSVHAR
jgi:S1-C subfamily serine protease